MNKTTTKQRARWLGIAAAAGLMMTPQFQAPSGVQAAASKPPGAPQWLEDEAEAQFNLSFSATPAQSGSLSVVYDYVDAKNFYTLEMVPGAIAVKATIGGATKLLGRAPVKIKPSSAVVLKRRRWVTEVVVDRRVALETYDATFNAGKIGSVARGGWKFDDARVQPVEDIYFADDFTRLPGEKGEWKYTGGWTQTSSSEESAAQGNRHTGVTDRIEMSANPFAFRAQSANGTAWAQTGRWFWDDYEAQVSVKPLARGAVGMAVYAQDEKNYLGFTWSANESPNARQLVRVVDGKSSVLASAPGAFLPRQWYRLSMRTSPGFVEAFIDGAPVFKAPNTAFGGGGIALLARNIKVADFDDARVTSYASYRQEFAGANGGAWTPVGGSWSAQNGLLSSSSARGEGGKTRFFLTGRQDWDGYLMNARAKAGNGAAGLVVGYKDDKNYSVFRWAGKNSGLKFANRQQLMRYANGKAKIVSDQPLTLALDKNGFAQVSVKLNSGAVAVYENERLIAQMADETLSEGRPALWAQGAASAGFRDVVMSFPPPRVAPKVASRMANDTLMVGWASPTGEWPRTNTKGGLEFWNTGEFFGDAVFEYSWRRASNGGGRLELALRAKRGDFNSGYVAQFEDLKEKNALRVSLKRGGATLKQADFEWKKIASGNADDASAKPVPLRVELEGRGVLIYAGRKPLMSYMSDGKTDMTSGNSFCALANGFGISARDLRATSEHRDDYTFSEAPTDWYAPQGEWSVISRWPCYADWSFFGGAGLNPTLWTKRTYAGDTVVEMYVHNQMDMPKEPGYSTPGNLNVSIGADGRNPSSGYSFIIAGWGNTKTRIYKGAQMVSENSGNAARFVKPINHNPIFHNRWFYVRAETRRGIKDGKAGVWLRVSVDDVLLCEYFDQNPLPSLKTGGRVALWTIDSVFMVARAKIESSVMGTRALPAGLFDADPALANANARNVSADLLVPRPVSADGLASALVSQSASDSSGGPVWTVRNPASGGLFAVSLFKGGTSSKLKVTPNTRLDMDITTPGNTHVDVYASVDGVSHLISLGKNERPDARVVPLGNASIGTVANLPGNKIPWKHVSFNLGAALKTLYPDKNSWSVDSVQIGALHGDEYRWQGFEGNPMGAAYQLRGARLSPG